MMGEHCSECYRFFKLEFDDTCKNELGEKTSKELTDNCGWCNAYQIVVSKNSPVLIDGEYVCEDFDM